MKYDQLAPVPRGYLSYGSSGLSACAELQLRDSAGFAPDFLQVVERTMETLDVLVEICQLESVRMVDIFLCPGDTPILMSRILIHL